MAHSGNGNNSLGADREVCVEVRKLWKVFGPEPDLVLNDPELRVATKEEVLAEVGCVIALRDVSFSVHKGEFFVLMGLSGSGKSTLIRCIIRLAEPSAGSVFINGNDICTFDEERLPS